MRIFIIILLALVAVWLDIALSFWWPSWLIPIWLWLGICIFIMHQKGAERWLWLAAVAAWGIYISSAGDMIIMFVIFCLGGELLNTIYKKYLPMSNTLLILVPSAVLLSICQVLFLLATRQFIGWAWLGRVIVSILAVAVVIFFYDPQKTKKKYF